MTTAAQDIHKKPCIVRGVDSHYNDAASHVEVGVMLVRMVCLALESDNFDPKARQEANYTLDMALNYLDAVAAWVLDVYNESVEAEVEEFKKKRQNGGAKC